MVSTDVANDSVSAGTWHYVGDETPTVAVVDAIAGSEGVDALDLPPISECIDPDALNTICESLDDGYITFTYCGYSVTVNHDMRIHVKDLDR